MFSFFSLIIRSIFGLSEDRGVTRWVTIPLGLTVVIVFVFIRISCFGPSKPEIPECLAYLSFDGNQAAVLSTRSGFAKGIPGCFIYKGAKDPDWNLHLIPYAKKSKFKNIRIENTENGVEIYIRNELEFEISFSDLKFDKALTIEQYFNSKYLFKVKIALYEIDETHPHKLKQQTENR